MLNFAAVLNSEQLYYLRTYLVQKRVNGLLRKEIDQIQSILVVRMDEIGDMITSLPAIEVLHKYLPHAQITVWCKELTADLVRHNPHIHRVVTKDAELEKHYQLVLDFRGNSHTLRQVLKLRPKWFFDRGSIRIKNKRNKEEHPHEVLLNLELIRPVVGKVKETVWPEVFVGEKNRQTARLFLQRNVIDRFVILHTGARRKLRRWSIPKYAELATRLHKEYGLEVVFAGDESEKSDISRIQERIYFPTFCFAGQGNLLDFAALCRQANLFVGNDSGPMHIASASGIPVIGLFGPGEPSSFAPYGPQSHYIHHKLPCHPCDQLHCVLPKNPCINHIEVVEVMAKAASLLDASLRTAQSKAE